ncbi:hypothetical protein ACFCV3_07185 [Kribbella sp. NPDC056345]|uniref:hypothetical protein n=1 Tax=Kribbella sp. NPDC056345 TaxID=3345789 RepID=UPI0035D5D225
MSSIEIMNVVFACPGNTEESYARGARPLAELLRMRIIREDWFLIGSERSPLQLAFGNGPIDYHPPRRPSTKTQLATPSACGPPRHHHPQLALAPPRQPPHPPAPALRLASPCPKSSPPFLNNPLLFLHPAHL